MKIEPGEKLAVLAMNIDGINTPHGYSFAAKFLKHFRTMMVIDESQRIKNIDAKRTAKAIKLGKLAASRRIASGTLIADRGPLDTFAQFEFLAPGAGLLGTNSYRAFAAEYAELLKADHPVMQEIKRRADRRKPGMGKHTNPPLIKKDELGRPIYRNLEKLQRLMSPYTFRVLKRDCLDLPEKIYQTQYFDLTPAQQRVYEHIKENKRYMRDDGEIDAFTALTVLNKLRQVTSGFIMVEGEATELKESGPRLDALEEVVQDTDGKVIVWASFREEIRQIAERLAAYGCVQYHGGVGPKDREAAIEAFQEGEARVFIANPAAGGVGLTLTAANTAIYYSCSFSLEDRLQSEDRCHRIGTHEPVVYIDLVARDTVDERIAAALQAKEGVATQILEGL